MKLTRLLAALAVALLATVSATPAHAATRPRPVTLSVVSSTCVDYQWQVTYDISATTTRTVDVRYNSDYGDGRTITDVNNVTWLSVRIGPTPQRLTFQPGASAQYEETRVLTAGARPDADALAAATVRDPIQYGPALC